MTGWAILLGFLASCAPAMANPAPEGREDQRQRAEALLERGRELSDIRAKDSSAFQLKAHIRILNVPGGVPEGNYEEFRNSRGQWRRALRFAEIKHTAIEVGDGERMKRYAASRYPPYVAFRIEQLLHPSDHLRLRRNEVMTNLRRRTIDKRPVVCVELRRDRDKREVCVDAESGLLVRLEQRSSGHKWVFEFADYAPLGNKRFPRRISEKEQKKDFIDIEIQELSGVTDPPEAWFTLPQVAEEWPVCDDPEPAVAVENPPPVIPRFSRRYQGSVLIYVVVGVDGRAYHAEVVRSEGRRLAAKTLDAVTRRWRFRPATCRGQPVPSPFFIAHAYYALGR
jgi:hypothetical protein